MVNYKYTDQLAATKPLYRNVEMKHCVEMNTQTNWLTHTNLSVGCRILENTRPVNVGGWTVQKTYYVNLSCKTTLNCKIPIVQVGWRFKLIQYSLNSQYCLTKLIEKSKKNRGIYTSYLLTKIVTAETWPSRVSDY